MSAEGYIVGFSIIFVFLAIGVVAMKSNNRKLLAVIAGLMGWSTSRSLPCHVLGRFHWKSHVRRK